MTPLSIDFVGSLYAKYEEELRAVRDAQRSFLVRQGRSMKAQLDDLEAEITYLLLRDRRPATVVEIGTLYGWSTTWILSALRDNGLGRLYSFDISDDAPRHVPAELSADRWTFTKGDMRTRLAMLPERTDYLFIDADHGARFAHWYISALFPLMPAGTPTSVHDVFHGRRPKPYSEGSVIVRWLTGKLVPYFTPSTAKAPHVVAELTRIKRDLGLAEPVRTSRANPMIFFTLP